MDGTFTGALSRLKPSFFKHFRVRNALSGAYESDFGSPRGHSQKMILTANCQFGDPNLMMLPRRIGYVRYVTEIVVTRDTALGGGRTVLLDDGTPALLVIFQVGNADDSPLVIGDGGGVVGIFYGNILVVNNGPVLGRSYVTVTAYEVKLRTDVIPQPGPFPP